MSDIAFNVDYTGTKEELLTRIKAGEQKAREKYASASQDWEVRWRDDGGDVDARVMGFDLSGQFDVLERDASGGEVKITLVLPGMLGMMKGPIEAQIKSEMKKLLG